MTSTIARATFNSRERQILVHVSGLGISIGTPLAHCDEQLGLSRPFPVSCRTQTLAAHFPPARFIAEQLANHGCYFPRILSIYNNAIFAITDYFRSAACPSADNGLFASIGLQEDQWQPIGLFMIFPISEQNDFGTIVIVPGLVMMHRTNKRYQVHNSKLFCDGLQLSALWAVAHDQINHIRKLPSNFG